MSDRRLLLEFAPGVVFLLANLVWGLFAATGAAIVAAGVAVVLRYRMDRQLPFLAMTTVALSLVLLVLAVTRNDEHFIKIRPTIGSLCFALAVAGGMLFRPSLLQRSLGYKLTISANGWRLLHGSWIALALGLAVLNELIRRNASTDLWVLYASLSGPLVFGGYAGVTWAVAWLFWTGSE